MPFRDAHEAVARAVKSAASRRSAALETVADGAADAVSRLLPTTYSIALSVDGSVAARNHPGGTAPQRVRAQVAVWRQRLAQRAK